MTISGTAEWQARLKEIDDQLASARSHTQNHEHNLGDLMAKKAEPERIAVARDEYDQAVRELSNLETAKFYASHYEKMSATHEENRAQDKQVATIKTLQKKRKKALEKAQDAFSTALVHLVEAEELGLTMHEQAGGIRPTLEALNFRHGPVVSWTLVRLLGAMPKGVEKQAGAVLANLNHARHQMEGKTLADLQPDYAKLAKEFHEYKAGPVES